MREQLVASARAGESITRTAERLLDEGDIVVRLPQHVEALRDAARTAAITGDPRAYERAVSRWRSRIARLGQAPDASGAVHGEYTVRSATQRMVEELRGATEEQIGEIVDRWVLDRARHQARVIARHETVEAYRESYRESLAQTRGVVGVRWTLSSRHPHADECDVYANQDLYGLGPGGYPMDRIPPTPHPMCIPPGHLIETASGPLAIEQVAPGDLVRSHTGEWQRVLRLSTSRYEGDLVVATIGDRRLVATPEHPLLTAEGWKAADRIRPGDRVFVRVDPNNPPSDSAQERILREVTTALLRRAVPVPGVYLNGGLQGDEPQVDVELPDRELRDSQQTDCGDGDVNPGLVLGHHGASLHAEGSPDESLDRVALPAVRSVGGLRHLEPAFGTPARGSDPLLLGGAPLLNASSGEPLVYDAARDADALRDLEDAEKLADVEPNDLVGVYSNARHEHAQAASGARSVEVRSTLLGVASRVRDFGRGGSVTELDSGREDPATDRIAARSETAANLVNGEQIVHVEPDDFITDEVGARAALACAASGHFILASVDHISRRGYAGPVHNFAVDRDKSYCVDGIVTHNCLCTQVAIIDRHAARRELAQMRGEPEPPREWESGTTETGAEWLARQTPEYRREMLGPTRARIFEQPGGRERVMTPDGRRVPVHQVLGQPPPARRLGPAVRALPIVRDDRASMAQPFPAAPRLAPGDDGRRR